MTKPYGLVRGPGTGTSDSIPDTLRDGDFIMTAKATKNLGHKNLDKLVMGLSGKKYAKGGKAKLVPALISNGEYKVPREATIAFGKGSVDKGAKKLHKIMKKAEKKRGLSAL